MHDPTRRQAEILSFIQGWIEAICLLPTRTARAQHSAFSWPGAERRVPARQGVREGRAPGTSP
ncbi:MAG: hypothetical protein M0Z73_09185 [Betaproteobacteria bacterium]|nr:hypothetical protein [Betaproteobacteria bacterium]